MIPSWFLHTGFFIRILKKTGPDEKEYIRPKLK